jgi:hypothetical protein
MKHEFKTVVLSLSTDFALGTEGELGIEGE